MNLTKGSRPAAALALAVILFVPIAPAWTQSKSAVPVPKALTIEEAVAAGLAADPGILSAALDARAAAARAIDAKDRMLPSLSFSAGYTRLSEEPLASTAGVPANYAGLVSYLLNLFQGAPSDSKDIRIDLQYPVFAGFRLREAAEIARLQTLGKEAAAELARRAMTFEIRRAYWESVRASASVEALRKALELESVMRDETSGLAAQGMATDADRLGEQARYDQATLALDDAQTGKELAFLMLASLIGDADSRTTKAIDYSLTSIPGAASEPVALAGSDALDEAGAQALLEKALANRPETRAAAIVLGASAAARIAAKADLYPSLALTGSLSYADPDPRLFPPQDLFNLTWSIGARLRYDIGGLPGAMARGKAAEADIEKSKADLARQRNAIALDLRKCVLALRRAHNSLELTRGMVGQAEEARRVAQSKFQNGVAKRSEVLQAEMALLRSTLAVETKSIDAEIAQADLLRAAALE